MSCNDLPVHRVINNRIVQGILTILLSFFVGSAQAQVSQPAAGDDVVEIVRAQTLKGLKTGSEEVRELTGNVVLKHKGALMYCDRAIQNRTTNTIEAYGHARMVQGDTVSVKGDTMYYYGANRQANVRGNVVLRDRKMTLTTQRLNYDMAIGKASYPVNGRIIDSENILTSREGDYYTQTKQFEFRRNVKIVNPKYTLTADSLLYNSLTKIATFQGPTKIISKDGTLIAKEGQYNTISRVSNFQRRATVETDKYTLTGDSLGGNSTSEFYVAKGNVVLVAKNDKTTLTGNFGRYNRQAGVARMVGNAVVQSISGADTLFMRADTLWSFEIPDKNPKITKPGSTTANNTKRRLIGHHNVLIFKSDLQSKCDSIVYETADSTIYFFRDPIVWSTNYQMEADSMTAKLKNNRIHTMYLRTKSFVISQDTLQQFNQVKGRSITAYFDYKPKFDRSDIELVVVEGNGESNYFALDEKNKLVGMNHVQCSKMNIRFDDRKVKNIKFIGQPDSQFVPPHELRDGKKQLDGFNWRKEDQPTKAQVLGLENKPDKQLEKPKEKSLKTTVSAKPLGGKTVLIDK
ncbi:OstA-like protein [Tellurirhabdus bombi]|uniref:OstA-like protein n=1 Tax=Tellurirhabdus bombi TaxID=2907205 RepID=UPI001F31247F|nr:OstA-like protein [Tellurirhabdus bombi]